MLVSACQTLKKMPISRLTERAVGYTVLTPTQCNLTHFVWELFFLLSIVILILQIIHMICPIRLVFIICLSR